MVTASNKSIIIFTNLPFANQMVPNIKPFSGTPLTQQGENSRINSLLFYIRRSIKPYGDVLSNKLLSLLNFALEEDPLSDGISYDSLINFIRFILLNKNLKIPAITLTPDSNIYASWKSTHRRLFSSHFLPNGDVRFVLFKPNDKYPKKMIRISGTVTVDILMNTLSPYNINKWVINEK